MPDINFTFRPMTETDARKVIGWRYDPPYSIYNLSEDHLEYLLAADNRYFSVFDDTGSLVGLCCFSAEARVQGGNYPLSEPVVLDLGLGLRPDLTGQGLGETFLRSILDFAGEKYSPKRFRATVAKFNRRSQRTFQALGFTITHTFIRPLDGLVFIQLERKARNTMSSTFTF